MSSEDEVGAADAAVSTDVRCRILTVCTGNIARSPAAERLLRNHLGPTAVTSSAGTRAVTGSGIVPEMAALIEQAGADASGFAARQLTEDLVRDADVVLCLEREHRRAVLDLVPGALRRTFTLREFARLLTATAPDSLAAPTPGERLLTAARGAALRRGGLGLGDDDDIADPYGRRASAYLAAFTDIRRAVDAIAAAAVGAQEP